MFDPSILITGTLASLLLPLLAKLVPALGQKLLDFFFSAQLAEVNARFQRQLEEHKLGLQRDLETHKAALAREMAENLEAVKHEYAKKLADHQADRQRERELALERHNQEAARMVCAHGQLVEALKDMHELDHLAIAIAAADVRRVGMKLHDLDRVLVDACFDSAELREQIAAFDAAFDGCDLRDMADRKRICVALHRIEGLLKEVM